jgi:hypothetical protein
MVSAQRGHISGVVAAAVAVVFKEEAEDAISECRSCSSETHPESCFQIAQRLLCELRMCFTAVIIILSFNEAGLSCSYLDVNLKTLTCIHTQTTHRQKFKVENCPGSNQ